MNHQKFISEIRKSTQDQKIMASHPLLSFCNEKEKRIAFFQGVLLATSMNEKKLSDDLQEYVYHLGLSLSLSSFDIKECMSDIENMVSESEPIERINEILTILSDKIVCMLFICEFSAILSFSFCDIEKNMEFVVALSERLDVADFKIFFESFLRAFIAFRENKASLDRSFIKLAPKVLQPHLSYFFRDEVENQSTTLKELQQLIDDRKHQEDWNKYIANTNHRLFTKFLVSIIPSSCHDESEQEKTDPFCWVIKRFHSNHPEISEYQMQLMLLPVLKKHWNALKKEIDAAEGKQVSYRWKLDLHDIPVFCRFMRYLNFMDRLTVVNPRFMMIHTVSSDFYELSWTGVREPEETVKEEKKNALAVFFEEIENRCNR